MVPYARNAEGGNAVDKLRGVLLKRELYLASAILLAGALLRFLCLGRFPPGLNQDEASIGFDAWSLLQEGIDRNGDAWPVLFVSWGSGQNVLYAYLSLPFLALFGLSAASLRLCAAFWGSVSLAAFWLLARRAGGRGFGLLALYGVCSVLRSVLEPHLVGRQLGLPPLLTLMAFYIGYRLFGVAGMVLLPLAVILVKPFLHEPAQTENN